MNKLLTSLAFVVLTCGCHPTPEGAVCPPNQETNEEAATEAEHEATSADEVPADVQKISEEEIERSRRRRHYFLPSGH